MDKRVIFAVAGSGKTTYIVNSLSLEERCLIITYTDANYNNLYQKILQKFRGYWPINIVLMRYFTFLYRFCYKPFLADEYGASGICYVPNENRSLNQSNRQYYITKNRQLYSNRISLLLERKGVIPSVQYRLKKYFDRLIIDEIQDIAGRDFNYLEQLMTTDMSMLFVGDFYQHTYDTSRDGNVNSKLFANRVAYEMRFKKKGILVDTATLKNSWRCNKLVCEYVTTNLGIDISSNREDADNGSIAFVSDVALMNAILLDNNIIKLHLQNAKKYGMDHRNWGDTKGEDCYEDVCILLNKNTLKLYRTGKLIELAPLTRNKLYVAITRARRNVYFIDESTLLH